MIKSILRFLLLLFTTILERNKEKKAKKKEILKEVQNAIKKKDNSAITSAFDRLNRL